MSKNGNLKIESTKNYDQFKFLPGNRLLDEKHVLRLITSMRQRDFLVPIAVNSEMYVIDGQHRLEARKRLELVVPYYMIGDLGLQEVQSLNAQQKKWSIEDFTNSFIRLGNKDYEIYKWFRDRYRLSHVESVAMLSGDELGVKNRNYSHIFALGGFKVKDLQGAKQRAEMLEQIAPFFDHYNQRSFVQAFLWLLTKKSFDFKTFLQRLEAQPTALRKCSEKDQYIDLIEQIYNYRSPNKVSLRYGD